MVVNREEVTVFDPPNDFGYTMLAGLPLRDYQARVRLSDDGEGTEIRWHVEFDPKLPGTGGSSAARSRTSSPTSPSGRRRSSSLPLFDEIFIARREMRTRRDARRPMLAAWIS